jgi:hypothetical protein
VLNSVDLTDVQNSLAIPDAVSVPLAFGVLAAAVVGAALGLVVFEQLRKSVIRGALATLGSLLAFSVAAGCLIALAEAKPNPDEAIAAAFRTEYPHLTLNADDRRCVYFVAKSLDDACVSKRRVDEETASVKFSAERNKLVVTASGRSVASDADIVSATN